MTSSIKIRFALFVAALAISPLTAALHAQTGTLRVNVPFAFQNGSQVLPAGSYTIAHVAPRVLSILGSKTGGVVMLRVESSDSAFNAHSKVVFQRYGDKYYLREVWTSGSKDHAVCVPSGAEMKAQKAAMAEVAAAKPAASTVEVSSVDAIR